MTEEMDRAADDLADARLEYALAESNLAVARGALTRAERRFHEIWGGALRNLEKHPRPSDRKAQT